VTGSLASWSQPADPTRGRIGLAAVAALALFIGSWALLHVGFFGRDQVVDTPVYQRYGDAMADGQVPYRDFRVEYPPGALPMFVLPSLARSPAGDLDGYERGFEVLMWLCGAGALAAMAVALLALDASPRRAAAALAFTALAPLALGSVILTRFDLWPAALTAVALALLLSHRPRLALGALAAAVATKIYPAVLLPVFLAFVWRRHGRRRALVSLGVFATIIVAVFLPFVILAPGGVASSIGRQLSRPLQIESLGSSFLLVAHQAFGLEITMRSGHGSQNLVGVGADVLAVGSTVLQTGALLAIWAWFARGRAGAERMVRASAAAVCAFVGLGKVLSPQFLIWLVPLVPLVARRRGLAAAGALAGAMILTQGWFPSSYWDLALRFDQTASWLVFVRDLVLIGLLAILLWPLCARQGAACEPRYAPSSLAGAHLRGRLK
jgi:hypothetical protein